jgi:hypothetical protein
MTETQEQLTEEEKATVPWVFPMQPKYHSQHSIAKMCLATFVPGPKGIHATLCDYRSSESTDEVSSYVSLQNLQGWQNRASVQGVKTSRHPPSLSAHDAAQPN